jgi:2-oxo-4-hydroxy-4-carboxy-5-ureidoimidazoline decarboxylase
MTIAEFDQLPPDEKKELLFKCCGSTAWVKGMMGIFPVQDLIDLFENAEEQWYDCNPADWLEAFEHHPKIGDLSSIQKKFSKTAIYTSAEQSGVDDTPQEVLEELIKYNQEYEENFGYIFIVYATGKSAEEMLDILKSRIDNDPHEELLIAAGEQDRITKNRLQKLFE